MTDRVSISSSGKTTYVEHSSPVEYADSHGNKISCSESSSLFDLKFFVDKPYLVFFTQKHEMHGVIFTCRGTLTIEKSGNRSDSFTNDLDDAKSNPYIDFTFNKNTGEVTETNSLASIFFEGLNLIYPDLGPDVVHAAADHTSANWVS